MGGLKRRKGMRYVTTALSENSRLIPYIYTYADTSGERFLVEIDTSTVRVIDYDGNEHARFESSEDEAGLWFEYDAAKCYYKQINNLLIITSLDNPPMVLKRNRASGWVFEPWKFKQQMWRYNYEERDYPIEIQKTEDYYNVVFNTKESDSESALDIEAAEYLRASFWTEQQEAYASGTSLRANVKILTTDAATGKPVLPATVWRGQKFAVATELTVKYYVCIKDWSDAEYYTPSLDSPSNYPNNFIQAENEEGFEGVTAVWSIHDVNPGGTIAKDTKIAIKQGYWDYYTCINNFTKPDDDYSELSDYPGYFIKGLAVGNALPCRGEWAFYCSGLWYGCYEIRRNYDSEWLYEGNWENRGQSFSRNESASNLQPTGSEADEVCWIRLFLTKSKRMADSDIASGFVQDSTGNRLIVKSYKHDLILKCTPVSDGAVTWECFDKVQVDWGASRKVTDWSWQAFSYRYGYPLLCEVYNKRLVFASTDAQPQTIWMSRTDDLNNFATSGSAETAAMALTLNTTSQNPICWLHSQSYRLMLGTSEAEFSISAGQSQAGISNSNAQIEDHSHVGSDGIAAMALSDLALFVERGAGRVYSLQYSFQIDGYTSRDISVFAPHIAREHGGIKQMSSIRKPDTVGLFVLGDGQLGLCTHNTFHEINAWHRWVTDGKILSVCGMPDGMNDDKVFLIVKRQRKTAAGVVLSEATYIEVVDSESDYTDSGRDYESLVVVNAMIDFRDGFFGKKASEPNYLCLGADFHIKGDNIMVSDNGGKRWLVPPHAGDNWLRKGWNKQYTPSGYKYEVKPSVKVKGNQGIHILAIRD